MKDCPWPITTTPVDDLGIIEGIDVTHMNRDERLRVLLWLTEKNAPKEKGIDG